MIYTSKGNCVCRAGLRAGSGELTIKYFTSFRLCCILCFMNTLNTECAFFHDTTTANSHIRVKLVMKRENEFSIYHICMERINVIITPVEGADLIWAVICTITCAYTTVINL